MFFAILRRAGLVLLLQSERTSYPLLLSGAKVEQKNIRGKQKKWAEMGGLHFVHFCPDRGCFRVFLQRF